METCSFTAPSASFSPGVKARVESPGLRTLAESRDGGLAVLPGLFFLSFLPGLLGRAVHPCSVIPVCSLLRQHPRPRPPEALSSSPTNWSPAQGSVAKSATWSGLLQKDFQHLPFDQSQVCKKKKDTGSKFLEQGLQTLHLPEEKLPATEELLPKWTPKILFFCWLLLGASPLPLAL